MLNEIINDFEFAKNQIDDLTKTWNRCMFLEILDNQFKKSLRTNNDFSLVFFDIDDFKKINDKHTHSAGDLVLRKLLNEVKSNLREYDTIGRWGGEEFLILLPETKLEEAVDIITRLKDHISDRKFSFEDKTIDLTCSFGINSFNKDISIEEMINNADKLMYTAKKNGKNRVEY